MEHRRLKLIVWYLVFTRLHEHMVEPKTTNDFDGMSELKKLCPYSSFCGRNASSNFPYTEHSKSCCQSCSCNADCGLRGDCCFSNLDVYNIGRDNTICRHTFAVDPLIKYKGSFARIANPSPHYRMIDKCDNTNTLSIRTEKTCKQNSSDIEESFLPMYSPNSGHIYINAYCAICNNITDAIPWHKAIVCTENPETSLIDSMDHLAEVDVSDDYTGCFLYYMPPVNASLNSELCYPNMIRTCNTTGNRKVRYDYWDYCEMFNATFLVEGVGYIQTYANAYCFLCNKPRGISRTRNCTRLSSADGKTPFSSFVPLTIIIDMSSRTVPGSTSRKANENDQCPINSVMVNSFTKSCRRRKCPIGQLLINNRCDYFSKEWIGGPFAVVLWLSPTRKDLLLPIFFFEEMSSKDKYNSRASWFRRKTLRRWKLLVMYHPTENQATIDYIVLKATHPSATHSPRSVDPRILQRSIQRALLDQWKIVHLNVSFSFKVYLNEHLHYDWLHKDYLRLNGINVTNKFAYLPRQAECNTHNFDINISSLLLIPIRYFEQEMLKKVIFITKLFFCDQVELLPEEYDYSVCSSIFFKVKNVTLFTFSTVQDTSALSQEFASRVYVCLHEFEHVVNAGTVASFYYLGLILITCICVGRAIIFTVNSKMSQDLFLKQFSIEHSSGSIVRREL